MEAVAKKKESRQNSTFQKILISNTLSSPIQTRHTFMLRHQAAKKQKGASKQTCSSERKTDSGSLSLKDLTGLWIGQASTNQAHKHEFTNEIAFGQFIDNL